MMKQFVTASMLAVVLLSAAARVAVAGGRYFGHHGHFGHHHHHHHSGLHFSFGLGHHYGYRSYYYQHRYHYPVYSYRTQPYYLYSYPTYSAYRWAESSPWCSSRVIYRTEKGQTQDQIESAPAVPESQVREPAPDPPPEPLPESEDANDSVNTPGNKVSDPIRFVGLSTATAPARGDVGEQESQERNSLSPAHHYTVPEPPGFGSGLPALTARPLLSDDEVPLVAE